MRFYAVFLAAAIPAASAFAADWNPAADFKMPATAEIPAPAASARALPRDGQNYSAAEEILIKEFALDGIAVEIPEAEVIYQDRMNGNALCFELAFRQALTNFLENYNTSGSALSDTLKTMGAAAAPTKSELKKARQKILALMNTTGSAISLVSPYRFYQPANGEKVEKNWVFHLRLGDKTYWAIVDRSGQNAVYNYGNN